MRFSRDDIKFQEKPINFFDSEEIYPCSLCRKFVPTMEQLLAKYEILKRNIRRVHMAKVGIKKSFFIEKNVIEKSVMIGA